ncbi:hypothetical protein [Dyadobacter alkalitolerans]|uniref:hypothetical protein n=1 Tax=Dyadobacter alkalitolerans TaxID=492736 RepID=UPI0003F6FEA5|nr:hypothetical protein [Dyadobacter alkalitolerans]
MKQTLFLFLIAASLMGCEKLGLKDEESTHQVSDVKQDEDFVIENKKQPAFVYFTIEGQLSHDAKLVWSDRAPGADSVFINPNEISLPKGKVNIADVRGDYYNKKLYVRYIPLNDSTSGALQIKIKI